MKNKQPFYHRIDVLFTATNDVSDKANSPEFRIALARFLKRQFGSVIPGTVEIESPVEGEPGDPANLL